DCHQPPRTPPDVDLGSANAVWVYRPSGVQIPEPPPYVWAGWRGGASKCHGMHRRLPLVAAVLMLATLAFPAAASSHHHRYDVTITRTEYGIPHIVGKDFGSIGYGYGYAFAQDNLCVMAADYVSVEGQRSRWFGPTASYQM